MSERSSPEVIVSPANQTRRRLQTATVQTLRDHGIAGLSARTIARAADVNQALIFYHYDSVENLLAVTAREVSRERAEQYRERLGEVASFGELAATARQLHEEEHSAGNLALLTQLLAGVVTYPALADTLEDNFEQFVGPTRDTLVRLLAGSVLEGVLDTNDFARAVAASILGAELLHPAADTAPALFDTLDRLAGLTDALLDAGSVSTAILRRRL